MQEARQIFTQLNDLDKEDMNMNHKANEEGDSDWKSRSAGCFAGGGEREGAGKPQDIVETGAEMAGDREIRIQWRGFRRRSWLPSAIPWNKEY